MIKAAIVTISDRSSRGERADTSGPLLSHLLAEAGAQVVASHLIPDEVDQITALLTRLADDDGVDLVVTTGGTGPAPRDVTPEATRAVIDREMPGLAELLRWDGYRRTPFAVLSRGVAGIRGQTLIINLPGSPRAVREGMEVLSPLLPTTITLIKGEALPDGPCAPQPRRRLVRRKQNKARWGLPAENGI